MSNADRLARREAAAHLQRLGYKIEDDGYQWKLTGTQEAFETQQAQIRAKADAPNW